VALYPHRILLGWCKLPSHPQVTPVSHFPGPRFGTVRPTCPITRLTRTYAVEVGRMHLTLGGGSNKCNGFSI
jgi:hypothetical protein